MIIRGFSLHLSNQNPVSFAHARKQQSHKPVQSQQAAATAAKVRLIEVDQDHSGQRIDNFLLAQLKGVPRSMIYRLLRTGQVRVNKGRKKPHYKLNAGDIVRIPPVTMVEREPSQASYSDKEKLSGSILFEDKSLIILNKPAGMAVHGGSGISYGVIEAFRQLRPECRFPRTSASSGSGKPRAAWCWQKSALHLFSA